MRTEYRASAREIRMADGTVDGSIGQIRGYGAVFDTVSEVMYTPTGQPFTETLEARAVDDELLSNPEIFALSNHEASKPLGRNGQNMSLRVDDVGIEYTVDLLDTSAGRDAKTDIDAGIIHRSSYGFSIAPGGEEWELREGIAHRNITRLERLYDMSPVAFPAFADTSVASRGLQAFQEGAEVPEVDLDPVRTAMRDLVTNFLKHEKRYEEVYANVSTNFGVWLGGDDANPWVQSLINAVAPDAVKEDLSEEEIRSLLTELRTQLDDTVARTAALETRTETQSQRIGVIQSRLAI